jgi:hypothetical protein
MLPELVGGWVVAPDDPRTVQRLGNVSLEFSADGRLTYTIHCADKDQIMYLTYSVGDGILYTNQPSAPHEERTEFSIEGNKLILMFAGQRSAFIRLGCNRRETSGPER